MTFVLAYNEIHVLLHRNSSNRISSQLISILTRFHPFLPPKGKLLVSILRKRKRLSAFPKKLLIARYFGHSD